MGEGHMHLVHAVLEALEIIAGGLGGGSDLDDAFALGLGEGRKMGRLALAEIGEDETHVLAGGIGLDADLLVIAGLFGGLFGAGAGAVELPAMIDAADFLAFHPAQMHGRPAMGAALGRDLRHARFGAEDHIVVAHDADRLGAAHGQIIAVVDRNPELAHENAAGRSRLSGCKVYVIALFGVRLHVRRFPEVSLGAI